MLTLHNELAFYPSSAEREIWKQRKGSVPRSNSDEPQHGAVPAGTCFSHSTSSSSLCSKKGLATLHLIVMNCFITNLKRHMALNLEQMC